MECVSGVLPANADGSKAPDFRPHKGTDMCLERPAEPPVLSFSPDDALLHAVSQAFECDIDWLRTNAFHP